LRIFFHCGWHSAPPLLASGGYGAGARRAWPKWLEIYEYIDIFTASALLDDAYRDAKVIDPLSPKHVELVVSN
jgi:hypothetical protein